ncbi:MAG: SH3 domain-containing protein [Anaerolineae bacterium]|nr:SH3 domain-containing protein [Anaerolineae bacterium]NUQ03537.1 SH3 domain-containing protein [Anaerolineae bacterium]
MPDLQQRLDELRRAVRALPEDADAASTSELERQARALLADAKNTPLESDAQAVFGELARIGSGTSPTAATVRGLVRRARIRIEIAGDDDDVDEAIDILAEALSLSPRDPDVIALLVDASRHNAQAQQRVNDLFTRHQVERKLPPRTPVDTRGDMSAIRATGQHPQTPLEEPPGKEALPSSFVTSSGYPPPERDLPRESTRRTPGQGPLYSGGDVDSSLSEMTQAYYSGEYQQVIDLANRVLNLQPGNATALEYRQKAEDNLIRGVVPDHRIPFDARVSFNRANSLVRAGNYDEAERLYREARDIAERNGILTWKDAEQALLEIQDLALAREMINEGDRVLAADNWAEALRKYEGALRVVPNDPNAEDRIERVRRIQTDAEAVTAQLSLIGGALAEQAEQLQTVLGTIARLRQTLPNSPRLAQLAENANKRLGGVKTQLSEQSGSALNRAQSATALDEKLNLTNEAIQLLELGVKLDPADNSLSDMLLEARANAGNMQRARQVIERAATHIAQNYDNELLQARSMLSGLMDFAQDTRYRTVVNDLMSRYLERAIAAVEDGDVEEAQALLDTLQDEPFNIVGRRPELRRIESQLRGIKSRSRLQALAIGGGVLIVIAIVAIFTRPTWEAVIFPSPTPTPTQTFTPSATFTPSNTPTPSDTPTSTFTPTWTYTPSNTPTPTDTPTPTGTPTPTFTPTDTPSATPTPRIICRAIATQQTNIRAQPNLDAAITGILPVSTVVDIIGQQQTGGQLWFQVEAQVEGVRLSGGYVFANSVTQLSTDRCPSFP